MDLLAHIHQLPTDEKLKVMAFLWSELTTTQEQYTSPQWHKDALAETEQRLAQGKEQVLDWSQAKQMLRDEFK